MKLSSLVSILFTVGASCSPPPGDQAVADRILARLQQIRMDIEWDKPPTKVTFLAEEPTALRWWFTCHRVSFSIRKELVNRIPPGSRYFPGSSPKITVYYKSYIESRVSNTGNSNTFISADESTIVINGTADGRQIGAQVLGRFMTISGEPFKTWPTGKYKVRRGVQGVTCLAGNDCRIETRTYHIKVSGSCLIRPIINCGGEIDACQSPWSSPNPQFSAFRDNACENSGGPRELRYHYEVCEMHAPVLDEMGNLYTSSFVIGTPLGSRGYI